MGVCVHKINKYDIFVQKWKSDSRLRNHFKIKLKSNKIINTGIKGMQTLLDLIHIYIRHLAAKFQPNAISCKGSGELRNIWKTCRLVSLLTLNPLI